ncbi:hypothetical protein A6R68_00193, partial [Neotoma lepida]
VKKSFQTLTSFLKLTRSSVQKDKTLATSILQYLPCPTLYKGTITGKETNTQMMTVTWAFPSLPFRSLKKAPYLETLKDVLWDQICDSTKGSAKIIETEIIPLFSKLDKLQHLYLNVYLLNEHLE